MAKINTEELEGMKTNKPKETIEKMLSLAGIRINGKNPWDIKVHNENFYRRVMLGGSLALGESYMDKWWDCKALDQLFTKLMGAKLNKKVNLSIILLYFKSLILNRQSKSRAFQVGEHHYDAGNDLYELMLDKGMNYSCGYWKNAKTLDQAQEAKLDLICIKIGLKKGMTVLDIGCGLGGFAKHAAKKYKVKVTGITVSKEQVKLAKEKCKGLSVEIRLQDYRKVDQKFDRIVSVGMFEHVGYKNYREFMKVVNRCLKDKGLFLLHTISSNKTVKQSDAWFDKYIFPNGMVPSIKRIGKASERIFVMEDWHNFGADYDKTLMCWIENFEKNWNKIKSKYNERFYRMWRYYLLSCAGGFRARHNQLWQIVFSKNGVQGGYQSVR